MELGNLCFGHSRGSFEIPRNDRWTAPMFDLQEKIMEGCSPYGTPFENDIFQMRPYDWDAQCDCGYEDKEESFCEQNPHQASCWQFELKRIKNTYGDMAWMDSDKNHAKYEKAMKTSLKKFGIPYQGNAVNCTCSHKDKWQEFCEKNQHAEDCRLVQPNFLYKPTGFSVMWYKYALRDSYSNQKITLIKWQKMLRHCEESVND